MRQGAPRIGQEGIRNCFAMGQTVLVRTGRDWVSREILGITVLRNNVICRECGVLILGEPRLWFKDYGNIPLGDVMAKEDIDPRGLLRDKAISLGILRENTEKEE